MSLPIIRYRDDWDEIQLTPLQEGEGFKLVKSYRVQFQTDISDWFLTVPKGYVTDLASIPGVFRAVFRTWGKHTCAAICHDVMYSYGAGTKEMADDLFEALMLYDGVEEDDATVMAAAVRLFGVGHWNEPPPDDFAVLSKAGFA